MKKKTLLVTGIIFFHCLSQKLFFDTLVLFISISHIRYVVLKILRGIYIIGLINNTYSIFFSYNEQMQLFHSTYL